MHAAKISEPDIMRNLALQERPGLIPLLAALHLPQWQAAHPGWTQVDWG